MGWRSRYRIHEGSAFACAHYHSEAPEPITLVQKIMLFLRETQDVSFYGFSSSGAGRTNHLFLRRAKLQRIPQPFQ
jgi:hypothetical protein